jgi:hypothetical protein
MYLLLLVFGAVLTAAGIVLAASGVSVHDRIVDTTIVTPGIVAAVGGLLLIGLGLALRVLQRIEEALAVRPMPRAVRPGESAELVVKDAAGEPVRLPFPPKPAPQTQPAVAVTPAPAPPAAEMRPADPPESLAAMARQESAKLMQGMDVPAPPKSVIPFAPTRAGEPFAGRQTNGSAPPRPTRSDLGPRSPAEPDRAKGPAFDTLWPKRPQPSPSEEPRSAPVESAAPAVTVLKSGVVDGMAYTLYSDGSIAAELPQGTLRFGSIADLRNHLEQAS